MVAREDEKRIDMPIADVREHLPDGVGGSLEPFGIVSCEFSGQNLDKTGRERRESICRRDVAIQRRRIILSKDKDLRDARIDAVGNGNVDEAIFAAERNRGL